MNKAFVSVRVCSIQNSCARRVPDVRPCAARAWCHRVGREANWNEHDVALRATRPCYLWEPVCGASSDGVFGKGLLVMRCIVFWWVHVAKTRACAMKRSVPARAPHARVQSNTRMPTKQSNIGYTRARCVRDVRPCACGSRGVTERARNTRNGPRQKTRSSREQRRKKLSSWLVWGLSQSGRDRQTGQAYICAYPTPLVSAAVPVRWTTKNSRFLVCSKIQKKDSIQIF